MILFQRGRKMTELCATRMELDYAFVEFTMNSERRHWVKSAVLAVDRPLPVYPDEQTSSESVGMSQTCQ
jgi:hypothetical protein